MSTRDTSWTEKLGPMELAYVAARAHRADLLDVARQSYDALAERAAGSLLLADVDGLIHRRIGAERVQAACHGGTSRMGNRCLHAHSERGDLPRALQEILFQRRLRGSSAVLERSELWQYLAHGDRDFNVGLHTEWPAVDGVPLLRPMARDLGCHHCRGLD